MSVTEMVPISVLPAPEMGGRSAVYRIFGDERRLLYIGSSERPRQRWHEHRNRTAWWSEARAYSLTWLPTREAAYEAEALAIATEGPVFNQVWQSQQVPAARQVTEEAQRVINAMDEVEAIPDPEERARAISEVLADQAARAKKWRDDRRQFVLEQRAKKPKAVSYRKIAAMLGVSLRTVQDIEAGYSGSGKNRPKKSEGE